MAFKVTAAHHVSVLCTDFDRSREFYTDILGLEEIPKPVTFNFDVVWYRLGDLQIHLVPSDSPDTPALRHFALQVDHTDGARASLRDHGCVVEDTSPIGLFPAIPDVDRFFTRDPDGNRIEIMHFPLTDG